MQLDVAAAVSSAGLMLAHTLAVTLAGAVVLGGLHAWLCRLERQRSDFQPLRSTAAAATKPALTLLPFYAVARASTIASALLQVFARKHPDFNSLMRGRGNEALAAIQWVTQLLEVCLAFRSCGLLACLCPFVCSASGRIREAEPAPFCAQDCTKLVSIVFVAWAMVRIKDRVIASLQLGALRDSGDSTLSSSVGRLLDGASVVLSAAIWGGAAAMGLAAFGVNLWPVLASLGGFSVVIGLAAQSILGNVAAGVSLFASRPFLVGDRVQLVSVNGAVVAEGVVQTVSLSRTVLFTEEGDTVYVNNGDVAKMLIKNKSEAGSLSGLLR